jgi:hypothetical protein
MIEYGTSVAMSSNANFNICGKNEKEKETVSETLLLLSLTQKRLDDDDELNAIRFENECLIA